MDEFEIWFYENSAGKKPAKEFILALDTKMRAKILKYVEILKANGSELREPYSKHIDDGIFELRAKQGSDISRVLYFFMIGRKIVLTNGFIKKTPKNEIELAKKYRIDFLAQNKE